MPSLHAYDNYRLFIRDTTACGNAMSLRAVAQRAGLSSHGFLSAVIQGHKNMSLETAERLGSALGLQGGDIRFFTTLVRYNQATTPSEKQKYLAQLQHMRGATAFRKVAPDQYDYYSTWYLPVLREIAATRAWKGDYARLGKLVRPALTAQKAQEGVELLCRIGLLRRKASGQFGLADPVVTAEGIPGAVFRAVRADYLLRAIEASENLPPAERHLSFAVIGCSQKRFLEIQKKMDDLRRELLLSLTADEPTERVYAVSLQAFPVSHSLLEPAI